MIIAGSNPKGLDYKLYELQTVIDNVINNQIDKRFNWAGIVNIYGRVHKTVRDDKTYPEVYLGGGEYKDPFIDDTVTASMGFVVNSETLVNWTTSADIDLIVTANAFDLFGDTNRNMPKAQMTIYKAIQAYCLSLGTIKEGITDVFKSFSGGKIYQPSDLSQWIVFSLNFKISFNNKI